MKKVLGLVVSERRLGNSEILLKEIMGSITEPCIFELIRLTEMNIKPCKACYRCLNPEKACRIKDDFNFVLDKIKNADALLIGVPVYVLGPHGSLKMLTDRMLGVCRFVNQTRGKPCVLVIPYGKEGYTGYTKTAVLVLPRILEMRIFERWMINAALPGECLINEENLIHAKELGKKIFKGQPEFQKNPWECINCGADLFRFLPDGGIECPLCNKKGYIKPDKTLAFSDFGSEIFSHEEIQSHGDWLANKKETYEKQKEQIKEIQKPYKEMDCWVRPRPEAGQNEL